MRCFQSQLTLPCFVLALASSFCAAGEWKLVWSDEFADAGPPDPARWSYEEGFIRNGESQYYTVDRHENATVADGMLVITARKERWESRRAETRARRNEPEYADYTSASLHTRGKAEWTGGRVEVRAKLPGGRGTWPAIWMLGVNMKEVGWPRCGEIDIMEHVGFEPNRIHAHIHTQRFNHIRGTDKGAHRDVADATAEFHVYRVDWYADRLEFFLDDVRYFHYPRKPNLEGSWPFDAPHYLILNLAIGGSWGGREGIDDEIFPCQFLIDYVRVYQQDRGEPHDD